MQFNKHVLNSYSIPDTFLSAREKDLASKP